MGIKVLKVADIKVAEKKIERAVQALNEAVADEVAAMIKRTQSGRDKDNKEFAPYTPKYAEFKGKKGRNTSPPDLTFKGHMLQAITHRLISRSAKKATVEVHFNSATEERKARGNLKKRKFFGFNKQQLSRIQERIRKALK